MVKKVEPRIWMALILSALSAVCLVLWIPDADVKSFDAATFKQYLTRAEIREDVSKYIEGRVAFLLKQHAYAKYLLKAALISFLLWAVLVIPSVFGRRNAEISS